MKKSHKRSETARCGFSAAAMKKTVGRRYQITRDCDALSLRELAKAVDASIERRGLKRKPLTPSQSFAHTAYASQVRAAMKVRS